MTTPAVGAGGESRAPCSPARWPSAERRAAIACRERDGADEDLVVAGHGRVRGRQLEVGRRQRHPDRQGCGSDVIRIWRIVGAGN
ncbi:MAG: hypothetical protein M3445_09710 [Actinomycetota bacterium]|nr:hypothetical protein [Actinomycetota bacterium]